MCYKALLYDIIVQVLKNFDFIMIYILMENEEIMKDTLNWKKGTRSTKKDKVTSSVTEEKNYYSLHAGKSSFDCRLLIILTVELNTYAPNRFVIPIMHVQTWHKFQIFDLFSAWRTSTHIGHWTLLYDFSALLQSYIATYIWLEARS